MFNFQNPVTISVLLIECDIIRLEGSIGEFSIVIHESRLLYSIISFSLARSKVKLITVGLYVGIVTGPSQQHLILVFTPKMQKLI